MERFERSTGAHACAAGKVAGSLTDQSPRLLLQRDSCSLSGHANLWINPNMQILEFVRDKLQILTAVGGTLVALIVSVEQFSSFSFETKIAIGAILYLACLYGLFFDGRRRIKRTEIGVTLKKQESNLTKARISVYLLVALPFAFTLLNLLLCLSSTVRVSTEAQSPSEKSVEINASFQSSDILIWLPEARISGCQYKDRSPEKYRISQIQQIDEALATRHLKVIRFKFPQVIEVICRPAHNALPSIELSGGVVKIYETAEIRFILLVTFLTTGALSCISIISLLRLQR
ncbi:MAG: hypothetical protein K9G71_09655 [Rhodobacteraceae bacterium]|nr:hypothetical protein [Paracoccaceae bacterium]MCF8514597.1 hypothetical protein [Paracoccaceae bacterium]MCF8518862.1 hypothetical protein [Paracoccaceae bacterium]